MSKKAVKTLSAPNPVGPYSQAIANGPFLFCSGQIAIDPKTDEVKSLASVQDQTKLVMENIKAVLSSNGMNFSHVMKTTIFILDMADFGNVNEVYSQYFQEPYPARSTVAVAGLPKGVRVEIEVLAHKE
ncbi:MAG: RidA family protein [Bdellovibrionota bacterium]